MTAGEKKQKTVIIIIAVLAVLLAISLISLAAVVIYRRSTGTRPVSANAPDNIITPENATTSFEDTQGAGSTASNVSDGKTGVASLSQTANTSQSSNAVGGAFTLHKKNVGDNTAFAVSNLFPGDSETGDYRIRVSHKGNVVLRFHADVRPGYEKLAEVLSCRVVLPDTGETLYEGLMRAMPASLNYTLITDKVKISEVHYKVTAYLETDVGNAYMNRDLIADFRWWVEETEYLDSPKTGDYSGAVPWICLSVGGVVALILFAARRKKEDVADAK